MGNPDRDRTDAGRYRTEYDADDFLAAIDRAVNTGQPPTTPRIADLVGCSRRTAYGRLCALRAGGRVVSNDAGAVLLWWRAD